MQKCIDSLLLLFSLSCFLFADETVTSPTITILNKKLQDNDGTAMEAFWKRMQKSGAPIVEPIPQQPENALVTFVYRGNSATKNVVVFSQPAGMYPADNQLHRLAGTDLWFRSYLYNKRIRFLYSFSVNDDLTPLNQPNLDWQKRLANLIPDPLNPRRFPREANRLQKNVQSVLELQQAPPQPWIIAKRGTPAGKIEQLKLKSSLLKNERTVWVYTPPGYDGTKGKYGLLILFDGDSYIHLVPSPTILDNLIAAKNIKPIVAVFVDPSTPADRDREYSCYGPFVEFVATELVPWIRTNYRVSYEGSDVIISGSSLGGLAATCAAFQHPQLFGNVLSQSASFWWKPDEDSEYEWVARQFEKSPVLPLRFFLTVGALETMPKPGNTNQVRVNRNFYEVLKRKGYSVQYEEFYGAHEYVNWQGTLADGLIALAPSSSK